jgi:hypothetical protein
MYIIIFFTEYIDRMSDIADWFKRLPLFTRWWLALTAGFSLLGRFGIFKPYQLVLLYEPFIKQFQVISFVNQHLVQYKIWNKCNFKLMCILGHFFLFGHFSGIMKVVKLEGIYTIVISLKPFVALTV